MGNGSAAAAEDPTGTRHRLIEAQGLPSKSPEPARASGHIAGLRDMYMEALFLSESGTEQVACGRFFNIKAVDTQMGSRRALH